MRLDIITIYKIKELCLNHEVAHHLVLPYVKQFYESVPANKVFSREIITTAKNRIAHLKNESGISEVDVINERRHIVNHNYNNRNHDRR